ncbi:ABC transporter ATP-binding protein [Streptococcus suis]|uniref:ABC transporter ATP-binding protein n=4 Tax=Streptococcus suis TaxID=1307 RepID=UPI000CF53F7F|nr:ABC transporter ATP-binding protein [Streptococcus suis]MDW8727200.1 ABC transporter ATP-binding protein [Streptococcus suis]NQJ67554.1 ABC transporter ATP-binding protein [Streptococcus suis]NQL78699.1 ABC transporter ATP-binding protein [Streptococcus suis]HEL2461286.1 ABC transporter ATP-binding protein [Streptococcus suis]HEM2772533.1 ABC transporter ATP-binding protein [Streptococcus suis]
MNRRLVGVLLKSLNKTMFLFGIALSVLGVGMSLFLPQFIGKLLDQTYLRSLLAQPLLLSGFILFFISVYTIQALSGYLIGRSGSQSLNRLQKFIYQSLLKTSVSELDQYQSGDLASRLTNDMSVVLNFITVILPNFLMNVLTLGGSVYFLWMISPSLTLMSLLLVPLLALIMVPMSQKLENSYVDYQEGLGNISSRISHKFTNIRLMKAFQGEKAEFHNMGRAFDHLALSFERIIKFSVLQHALVSSLMTGFIILVLLVAGMEVTRGMMTMATLTTFVLYMMQLIEPVTDIASSLNELTEFRAVSKRLVELLELYKEEQVDTEMVIENTGIQLKNLHFSYREEPVLNGLSVDIPAGSHVAIVGPSGAGKSTIFALLMKYYQDYQGEIRIGQQCLSDISTKEMRRLISFIPQDNTLFHGTIRENLLYGKNESVSEERIAHILKELGLSHLVAELEDGLDTRISENGIGLSEGQKQRFSIARALLLEHPIYLLDEATASLDTVTERVISKAIDRLTAGKTRLTIAHRLHTVREADAILVLDKNGQVADYGPHQQLVERNHLYQDFLRGLPQAS